MFVKVILVFNSASGAFRIENSKNRTIRTNYSNNKQNKNTKSVNKYIVSVRLTCERSDQTFIWNWILKYYLTNIINWIIWHIFDHTTPIIVIFDNVSPRIINTNVLCNAIMIAVSAHQLLYCNYCQSKTFLQKFLFLSYKFHDDRAEVVIKSIQKIKY